MHRSPRGHVSPTPPYHSLCKPIGLAVQSMEIERKYSPSARFLLVLQSLSTYSP